MSDEPGTPTEGPRIVGRAKVICFTAIDHRHRHIGNCRQIVAGVLQGPAAGLAICRNEDEDCFYLFGCDSSWNTLTDTWHQTLDEALAQAEFEYEGVSKTWQWQWSWQITTQHLEAAKRLLPAELPIEVLSPYEDFLSHNELELAFDELEAIGRDANCKEDFWAQLLAAAKNMFLQEHAERCRRRLA